MFHFIDYEGERNDLLKYERIKLQVTQFSTGKISQIQKKIKDLSIIYIFFPKDCDLFLYLYSS